MEVAKDLTDNLESIISDDIKEKKEVSNNSNNMDIKQPRVKNEKELAKKTFKENYPKNINGILAIMNNKNNSLMDIAEDEEFKKYQEEKRDIIQKYKERKEKLDKEFEEKINGLDSRLLNYIFKLKNGQINQSECHANNDEKNKKIDKSEITGNSDEEAPKENSKESNSLKGKRKRNS